MLDIIVVARRLVDAEGLDEGGNGRCHAVTGIRVDVVAAQTGLHELGRRVTLVDGVLAGTENGDAGRAKLLQRRLAVLFHFIEGALPADRLELALLVELAILHPQQRLGEAILAVHDLGIEVALDTVQTTIDGRIGITLRRHDLAILGCHHDATTGATETAYALVPLPILFHIGGAGLSLRQGNANGRCGSSRHIGFEKFTTGLLHH